MIDALDKPSLIICYTESTMSILLGLAVECEIIDEGGLVPNIH
jgi:hypothetical protein